MGENEQTTVTNKSLINVKNVLRVIALLVIIFFFCPAFLVSCSGQNMEISAAKTVTGITYHNQEVLESNIFMIVTILIPVAMLLVLVLKKFADALSTKIYAALAVVDIIIWIAFRAEVAKQAEENYCSFETTPWYVVNVICLVLGAILALLVVIKKLELESDLVLIVKENETIKKVIDKSSTPAQATAEGTNASDADNATSDSAASITKKFSNKQIGGICGAIAAVVVLGFVISNGSKTINLNKYLTVEVEGYEGFGEATATIDWDAIEDKYGKKLSFTRKAANEYGGFLSMTTPVEALRDGVTVTLDKREGLSNGDKVKYTIEIEDDLEEYLNCKIKFKDGDEKVSGLEKVDTFDAFANLEVTFDGVGPNGTVNLNYKGSELSTYDFTCDKSSGLSNGDTIVVSINADNLENYINAIGKIPAESEKKYKVKGLESYVVSIDEIDEKALEDMKSQGFDVYNAMVASEWDESEELSSLDYIGNYLLVNKDPEGYGDKNYLYLVFKARVHNTHKTYDQVNNIYWTIGFSNLKVNGEGKVNVNVTDYRVGYDSFEIDSNVSDGWFGTKHWYYRGYPTLTELYKNVVTANADNYNHTDNVENTEDPKSEEKTEEKAEDNSEENVEEDSEDTM